MLPGSGPTVLSEGFFPGTCVETILDSVGSDRTIYTPEKFGQRIMSKTETDAVPGFSRYEAIFREWLQQYILVPDKGPIAKSCCRSPTTSSSTSPSSSSSSTATTRVLLVRSKKGFRSRSWAVCLSSFSPPIFSHLNLSFFRHFLPKPSITRRINDANFLRRNREETN